MPSGRSDGTIIINTIINTDGMDEGRDNLLKSMESLSGVINDLADTIKQAFSNLRTDRAVEELNNAGDAADAAAGQMEDIGRSAEDAARETEKLSESAERAGDAAKKAEKEYKNLEKSMQQSSDSVYDIPDDANDIEVPIENPDMHGYDPDVIKSVDDYARGMDEAEKRTNALKKALDEVKARLDELEDQGQWYGDDDFDETVIQYEQLNNQLKEYKKSLKDAAHDNVWPDIDTSTMEGRIESLKNKLDDLREKGKGFGDAEYDQTYKAWRKASDALKEYKSTLEATEAPEIDTSTMEGRIESLKNKLDDLREKGKGFGDAEYDRTYKSWKAATAALEEYKTSLDSTNQKQGVFGSMLSRAKAGILKVKDAFKSYHKSSEKAGASNRIFAKGLFSALKAARAMIMFKLLSSVIEGAKESLGNLVRYSDSSNDAMSRLVSSLDYLKNSLAAAFAPVLNVVCPILSTLIDYLAEAANGVAALMAALTGKSTYVRAKKQQLDYAKSLEDTSSAAGDASESLDEAKASAEDLEDTGIDEFNVLGDKDKNKEDAKKDRTADKGTADVFDTKPISGEIADLADSIKGYFSDIFKPIKDAWDEYGAEVILAWKTAIKDIIALGADIAETFRAVWSDGTGYEFISSILRLVATLGGAVDALAVSFKAAWDDNNNGYNYIQSIFVLLTSIIDLINAIGKSLVDVWNNGTGEAFFSNILQICTNIHMTAANIADRFREAWESAGTGTGIIQGLMDIVNDFLGHINNITAAFREWSEKIDFSPLLTAIDGIVQAFRPLADKVGAGLEWCFENILLPLAKWAVEQAVPAALDAVSAGFSALNEVLEALKLAGDWLWENFLEPIGTWTGEALITAMEKITDLFSGFGDWASGHQQDFLDMTAVIGSFFAAFKIAGIVKDIASLIGSLGGISGIVSSLGGLVGTIFNPIALAVAAVVAAVLDLWHTSESFRDTVISAFTKVKDDLVDAFGKVKDAVSPLWEAFKNLASSLYDFYENSPIKSIVALIASLATTLIGSAVSTLIDTLSTSFSGFAKILTGAIDIISGVFDILTAIFTLDFEKALEGFSSIGEGLQTAFSGALDLIFGIGGDLVLGLYNGIKDAISTGREWFKEHVVGPVVEWVKKLFGIHSPSTVFAEIGGFLIKGLLQGIKGIWNSVTDFFSESLEGLKKGFSVAWEKIRTTTSDTWGKIKTVCSDAWDNIKTGAGEGWEKLKKDFSTGWGNLKTKVTDGWKNVRSSFSDGWTDLKSGAGRGWDNIKTSFSKGWDTLKSDARSGWSVLESSFTSGVGQLKTAFSTGDWSGLGSNIMSGIHNGITAGWNWLTDTVSDLAGNLLQTAKYALGIQSPSRKFREEFGKNIPLGAAEGVDRAKKTAVDAVADMAESMQEAAGNPIEIETDTSIGKQALASVRNFFDNLAYEIQKGMDNVTNRIGTLNAAVSKMQHIEFPQIYQGIVVPPKAGNHSESNRGNTTDIDYAALKRTVKGAVTEAISSKGNGKCYLTVNIDGREWFGKWLELYQQEKDTTGVDPILGI